MKKVLVILGPTATGKTDLGIELAKKFNGEIIACDSRQVYRGLDIGTGKMPGGDDQEFSIMKNKWRVGGVYIHIYDVADPKTQFTVKDYVERARGVMDEILEEGKLPIVIGGTGLYLKAMLEGLSNLVIPQDEKIRGELNKLSLRDLQVRLQVLSTQKWSELNNSDRSNKRRIIRSIELTYMYGYVKEDKKTNLKIKKFNTLKIGLTAPRPDLNNRIDARLISRIDQGLIHEGERLYESGVSLERMRELGLEYGVLADFLEGRIDKNEIVLQLKTKIHQYAKRQMTWFKRDEEIHWFDITDINWKSDLENKVKIWYYQGDEPTTYTHA